jgi:hypothetical protein
LIGRGDCGGVVLSPGHHTATRHSGKTLRARKVRRAILLVVSCEQRWYGSLATISHLQSMINQSISKIVVPAIFATNVARPMTL